MDATVAMPSGDFLGHLSQLATTFAVHNPINFVLSFSFNLTICFGFITDMRGASLTFTSNSIEQCAVCSYSCATSQQEIVWCSGASMAPMCKSTEFISCQSKDSCIHKIHNVEVGLEPDNDALIKRAECCNSTQSKYQSQILFWWFTLKPQFYLEI